MQKIAREPLKDAEAEAIVQRKAEINILVSKIIKDWILVKRSWNGYETELTGNKRSRITQPLPESIWKAISEINALTNDVYTKYYGIAQSQSEFAEKKTRKNDERMSKWIDTMKEEDVRISPASRIDEIVKLAIAPGIAGRMLSHVSAPFISDSFKWDRLRTVRSLAAIHESLSEVEDDILSSDFFEAIFETKKIVNTIINDISPALRLIYKESTDEIIESIQQLKEDYRDDDGTTARKILEKLNKYESVAKSLAKAVSDPNTGRKIEELRIAVNSILPIDRVEDSPINYSVELEKDKILTEINQYKTMLEERFRDRRISEKDYLKLVSGFDKIETNLSYILQDTKDADRKIDSIRNSLNAFVANSYSRFYEEDGSTSISRQEEQEDFTGEDFEITPSKDIEDPYVMNNYLALESECRDLRRSLELIVKDIETKIGFTNPEGDVLKILLRKKSALNGKIAFLTSIMNQAKTNLKSAIISFKSSVGEIKGIIEQYNISRNVMDNFPPKELLSLASTRIERWLKRQRLGLLDWSDMATIKQTCDERIREAKTNLLELMEVLNSKTNLPEIKVKIIDFLYSMILFLDTMKQLSENFNNNQKVEKEDSRKDREKGHYSIIPYQDINDLDRKKNQLSSILAGING